MKTILWVMLFLCTSVLFAEVLFYDNFNRADGAVGNSWTNIGSATTAIENNAMQIISPNGTGIKHDFTPLSSGVVYIQYDWKVVSTGWYADAFPTGLITHLVMDWEGNLFYDLDGTMINQVALQQIGLNSYASIRLKIDLDADLFSVWINNVPAAENIAGNAVSSFSRFTFRGLGASTVQYVDNFMLFNSASPSGFTATGNLNNIALSWNAASYPEAVSYRIYRDTAFPATSLLIELPGTASGYTDTSAQPNTDYYYRIKAVQAGAVETDFSPELMAHLQPQISVNPQNITFNVGYGYSDSTYVTIGNSGNYLLEWRIKGKNLVPTDGLIAYYPFNGDVIDYSGNGHHGIAYNGVTFDEDRNGNSNSCASFDGINSFIDVGDWMWGGDISVSFWAKWDALQYYSRIFDFSNGPDNYNILMGNEGYASSLVAHTHLLNSGAQSVGATIPDVINLGTWQHIVWLLDSSGTSQVFLNSNLIWQGSQNIAYSMVRTIQYIARSAWDSDEYFNGQIDDIAFYDRVLSTQEIENLYSVNTEGGFSLCQMQGVIQPNSFTQVKLSILELLACGSYTDTLYVESNDPANPIIPVIITTNVLPPIPSITPDPLIVTLNVENPTREVTVQVHNQGQGKLIYNLSGTDSLLDVDQLPPIEGFTAIGILNNHSYYRSNTTMNWAGAKALCEQKGGHLVTFSSREENLFVNQYLVDEFWLGFSDEFQEGLWQWITNEPVTYTNWGIGEPNNIGNEDYCGQTALGYWADSPGLYSLYAVLEFDSLPSNSILSFTPCSGVLDTSLSQSVTVTVNGVSLPDYVYSSSVMIVSNATEPLDTLFIPVTVNVDYSPPLAITGLAIDDAATSDDQIGISWFANAVADSVVSYKIYRRGADETVWQLKATVPATQLAYVDSDFGDFVDTYQYYRVRAVDWVGNISAVGDSVMGALDRFLNPENMVIQNINNRDIHLSWDPVTETISGLPGTPTCYVIYKSQYPSPITDFDFLTISFTNEFTHQWALHFQPLNRLFYVVTAYGGDMGRMQSLVAQKRDWKYGELEQVLQESGFQQLDVIK